MFWSKQKQVGSRVKWGLAAAFAGAMVLNGLAGATRVLGGVNTAEVSDSYPNLFAPAGATFAIWGVIYLLLLAFIAYTFGFMRPKKSALSTITLTRTAQLLTINLVINALWILSWQYKIIWLSVLLIITLLITLIKIIDLPRSVQLPIKEYTVVKLPFSIYFGWITVATIANITTWLVSIGWNGFGIREGIWMVAVLVVGAIIGLVAAFRNNDPAYLAVFIWAYAGILLKHLSPNGHNNHYPSTIITLTILLAVFGGALLILLNNKLLERHKS